MSTVDPIGDGGGGGTSTSVDDNATPGTPSTDIAVPPGSQHHQHPPPSPLSGCYLLVVLPEPHTAQHRDLILNRLAKGFLSWDKDSCHVDLEKELQALVAQAPEGEEARNGERLIQYATENLVTEVLIHPQTNTLLQCIRNLLASFTKHRHIIHAGYTFGGNGSWILQDGTFSLADFLDAFSEHEVQRVLRAYENSVTVDINCAGVGEWSTSRLSKEACTRSCRVRLNPDDVLTAGVPAIASFTNYVGQYLLPQTLDQLMEPSDVVGNIRFSHPTLYVFPGGQGDAALFGINGFNMLVDGGFARKACFWDFARHLDRLDAVLVTRVNNSNVGGMSSVLRKKREMHVYPQIGHFFCNLVERRHSNSPDGDKDLDPLTLNLIDIGQEMMVDLRQINLRAHPCYRDPNPINLYHKVGHGTLDMYVLSPSKDSREVREFLSKWHSADSKLFAGSHKKDSNNLTFPIQNLASICALLVWQPANPEDTITRILFPGSTPQHKIFEGFERLKQLEFLKHPVCSAKSLSPSTSLLALKDRPTIKQKLGLIEKETKKSFDTKREKRDLPESKLSKAAAEEIVSKPTPQTTPVIPIPKAQPAKIDVKSKKVVENKKIETESKKIEKDLKEMKKESTKKEITKMDKDVEVKKSETMKIKSDTEKTFKETKTKSEPKKKETKDPKLGKISKIEMPPKPATKLPDKKPKPVADKKDSAKASPPTPKKTMNGSATKAEVASKPMPRPITKPTGKPLASSMPAKSAKDANNRKVVEQKNIEIASAASAAAPASAKPAAKPKTSERKPISRRTKPVSPSKARVPGSPAKSTRSTPTTSVKSDKDGVIRKIRGGDRGTTDSSTVSTPSGIEIDSMTKLADKSLTEKSEDMSLDSIESKVLADLKEEREVVEEIEAVLQKAERIEEARKDDHLEGDDDITAEATDKKEDDMTEDDVTADIEEAPKKKTSRKASQELTEEEEYLIVEKEEIYIEDSAQSGEGEQKHVLDAVESEKVKPVEDIETAKEEDEAEVSEEKEKSDVPEKKLLHYDEETDKEKEADEFSAGHKEQLKEEMKDIIASATEIVQKTEDKDDSGKKDSEDITKEPSSLSPDKFDSSEKKTTDTDPMKPEADQKDQQVAEKMEESQERISTLESGATTTAPTLPEDERIPLDDIKEVIDEKYIADEDKDKDTVEQVKESFVAPIPAEPKPDARSFQVRPAIQGIQREIVKTPDEVADLPVHEEVDPKLYRMEDFEKAKDEKPSAPPTTQQQETKEPPTPPVKEQKGVFSFFGKVADKFEKGMDKLTGKSRRDSEKDIDEKSSKSSSPKESKPQEMTLPSDDRIDEVNEELTKAVKPIEISETFEKGEPEVSKIKVAAITDTAAFLQREIEDLTKSTVPDQEIKVAADVSEQPEKKEEFKPVELSEPVFETCHLKDQQKDILSGTAGEAEEDVEDVEALLEEASKKFKTVKDSLHDSLESLEEKIVEEEMMRAELAAASKDVVKHTLSEVVEKLEEIKPHMEEAVSSEIKESDKVKFVIPKAEDHDDEEDTEVTKDFKEAVRDVGEVLAGSAGILIEEKPKDVIEIVKIVAEELKKADFLSHDVLFDKDDVPKPEDKISDGKSVKSVIEEIIPKKVGVTEELPPQEEIEELLETGITTKPLTSYKSADDSEVHEEPCVKTVTTKGIDTKSPVRDLAADKLDAMKICSDLMEEESAPSRKKRSIHDEDQTKEDVMEAGIESVCIKAEAKHPPAKEVDETREIEGSDIVFDRKLSPDKAHLVMVTPDSMPTSPKFPGAKVHTEEEIDETHELPDDIKNELDKEEPLEKIIENLVFTKKTKITIEIVEYITVIRKIPREKVIYIIEEIIIKKGVPRDSVVADLDLLKPDTASSEKRAEIEEYIDREYITKNKRITIDIVEEISIKKFVTKRIVIEIIEEIIVKKRIPRDAILDISEADIARLRGHRKESMIAQDAMPETSEMDDHADEIPEIDSAAAVRSEIEKYIADDIISKGKKITLSIIDEISIAKRVPKRLFIEILEEIIIKRKIPRSSILDISEKELSDLIITEKEDMDEAEDASETEEKEEPGQISVSSETRERIEKNIIDEYMNKIRSITPYIFDEICAQNKVSRRTLIQIIEELVVKLKVPRSSILDISDIELEEMLAAEKEEDEKESVAAASDDEDKKHVESETEEFESVTAEKLTEIENSIIDEYVSKSKRITPYVFEDICVRYKIPRRILIEIIEEVIVKQKIRRGSILDITDVELSELLVAAAGSEGDELDVRPITEQDLMPEDTGEDKLIDGFVSIAGKDVAPTKAISPPKAVELAEQALKESEKDVTDDFEAVEQEYKIHGTPISAAKESTVAVAKTDEGKISDDIEEAMDDDVSDVVEADEKIIGAVAPITVATTIAEKKSKDLSESSEIVDTTEKYLMEAQEKAHAQKPTPITPSDKVVDDIDEDKLKHKHESEARSPQEETAARKDSVVIPDHQKEVSEKEISQEIQAAVQVIEKTEVGKPSSAHLEEEAKESKEQESGGKSPVTEDKPDTTRVKRSIDEENQQRKDSLIIQEPVEAVKKMSDETAVPISTVSRMLVTASSEDGGQEKEVCATGSITFTTTKTPDDSLKSSPVKTTPDQDSLLLDKESLHTDASTPEKDSISGKSTPGTKDGDKITPEDSLDKSPSGTRDLQDLEDSLDKSEPTKIKETEKPKSPTKMEKVVMTSKLDIATEKSDDTVEAIIHDKTSDVHPILDEKSPTLETTDTTEKYLIEAQEKSQAQKLTPVTPSDKLVDDIDEAKVKHEQDTEAKSTPKADTTDRKDSIVSQEHQKDVSDKEIPSQEVVTDVPAVETSVQLQKDTDIGTEIGKSTTTELEEEPRGEKDKKSEGKSPVIEDKIDTTHVERRIDDASQQRKDSLAIQEHVEIVSTSEKASPDAKKISDDIVAPSGTVPTSEKTELEMDAKSGKPSAVEEESREDKEQESRRESAVTEDKIDVTRVKRSIDDFSQQRKDSLTIKEPVEAVSTSKTESPEDTKVSHELTDDDEAAVPTTTVSRMLVTSSSEDGGQEKEVCPTGSITFTATKTPEDSLKSSPVKTTPDQDSLVLDKESQRTGTSTPEKDSISDKSTPGTKDGDKITPEDSLDKSPSVTRDSQDLEDSLEKSDPTKLKETAQPATGLLPEKEQSSLSPVEPAAKSEEVSVKISQITESAVHLVGKSEETKLASETEKPSTISVEATKKPSEAELRAKPEESSSATSPAEPKVSTESVQPSPIQAPVDAKSEQAKDHTKTEEATPSTDLLMDLESRPDDTLKSYPAKSTTNQESVHLDQGLSRASTPEKDIASGKSTPGTKDDERITPEDSLDKSPVETQELKETEEAKSQKSPSIAGDIHSPTDTLEVEEKSRSPSIASEKVEVKESEVPSRKSSIAGDHITYKDTKELVDEPKTPGGFIDVIDDAAPVDRSKSPSIAGDIISQKDVLETEEKSRSPSIASEKQEGKESAITSKASSIAGDHIVEKDSKELVDETASVDRSKSPSIAGDVHSQKDALEIEEKSRSPSIASEKQEEKESAVPSKASSIADDHILEKDSKDLADETASVDRSKSPSISGDIHSQKDALETEEKSRSPSIASEKHEGKESAIPSKASSIASDHIMEKDSKELVDETASVDRSKSPSIAGDVHSQKDVLETEEKSRSPSIASEKHEGKESPTPSKASSIAGDQIVEKDSKELADETASIDRSKSPSIAGDIHSQKDVLETEEKSRSPSIASEKHEGKESAIPSKASSITGDYSMEKDSKELVHETASVDRSKSPSIAGDIHSQKDALETEEKSRSPSIASEKHEGKESAVPSKASSIAGDHIMEKDSKERADETASVDRSKSPSIAGDVHSQKDALEMEEKSRSPSIASEKQEGKESAIPSKSSSIAGDHTMEKDSKELADETASIDRSKSPSIVGDAHSQKDALEIEEKSRSPSLASEKQEDKESAIPSKASSIAGDHIMDKDSKELADETASVHRFKSSSIAGDVHSQKDALDMEEKSRSPSIASEKQEDKVSAVPSKASSIADDHIMEKDSKEQAVEAASVDRSKSPSIAGDVHSQKDALEMEEKSRSPSIASEKQEGKESTVPSKTSSIAGDHITEKDSKELPDETASIDQSKSPSIAGDVHGQKDALEIEEKSRSPSIASEKQEGKESAVPSKASSIAGDHIMEKDSKELADETASVDRSKSPSIAGDVHSQKDALETEEKSRSPSIASEKQEGKESDVPSKASSIAGDHITEKDSKELIDDTTSVARSKSPSIADDIQSNKDILETEEKSRSASIASEKHDGKESAVVSKASSVAGDHITEKDSKEQIDDTASVDRSKSPSIVGDIHSQKDALEVEDKSRSPSICSEKHEEKEFVVPSKASSISGDHVMEKDSKEIADDTASVDRSKSPSIAGDVHSQKDAFESEDKSRSPSIVSEKREDKESGIPSKASSIAGDHAVEKDLKELVDDTASVDRSKSPSIAGDRHSEKDALETKEEKSRSPSIVSDKHDGKESTVPSKASSIAGDQVVEKDSKEVFDDTASVDRSKSPSIAGDIHSQKDALEMPEEKSRSPSIASDKHAGKESAVPSRKSSIADDIHSQKDALEIDEKSRSPSVANEKHEGTEPAVSSRKSSIADDIHSQKDTLETVEKSRTPSIASEKHEVKETFSTSRKSSIDDVHSQQYVSALETDVKSRSPSIISEKHESEESAVPSTTSSVAGDIHGQKDVLEIDEKSRSPSIAEEKHEGKESPVPSRKSSTTGDVLSKKDTLETDVKSRSPSIASEKHETKESPVPSTASSIAGDVHSQKDVLETDVKSRSPSMADEKHESKESPVPSRKSSVAGDIHSQKDALETYIKSPSPSIVDEKHEDKEPSVPSRKSSIASDMHSQKDALETDVKSRSPSIASEKHDVKESPVASRKSSITGDAQSKKDALETHVTSPSPSIVDEKHEGKEPSVPSRKSSIASDVHSQKDALETDVKSRSPSIASEKHDVKKSPVPSRKSSITGDAESKKDALETHVTSPSPSIFDEKHEGKEPSVPSRKSSIASDVHSQKDALETDGKSRSPSIASEKHEAKESPVHSRKSSIAGEVQSQKDASETHVKSRSPSIADEKYEGVEPAVPSRKSSITSDVHSQKDVLETNVKSRSPSIASEKHETKESPVPSRKSSIAGDVQSQKDASETHVKSRSPSIADEKHEGVEPAVPTRKSSITSDVTDVKSRSPSIASEKHEAKESLVPSRKSSIAAEVQSKKDTLETHVKSRSPSIVDEEHEGVEPAVPSRKSSITSDVHSQKDTLETDVKSRSLSIADEKLVEPGLPSRKSSISGDVHSQKDASETDIKSRSSSIDSEKHEAKESAVPSTTSSIAGDIHSQKDALEIHDKSRSSSIASEKHDTLEAVLPSRTPSDTGDKITETDLNELTEPSQKHLKKLDDKPTMSQPSEMATAEPDHKSTSPSGVRDVRSPSMADEKHEEKETTIGSRSPSIISDKPDKDHSRSPSIADDKEEHATSDDHSQLVATKQLEKLDSSDKTGEDEPIDTSKSPSIAGDDHIDIDTAKTSDTSRKISLVSEKHSEHDATELEKSRSPSITSVKSDEKLPIVRSRSGSTTGDRHSEKDETEIIEKSRSPSILSEKPEEKSRSPSLDKEKPSEQKRGELPEKSRSPSIVSETTDVKASVELSKSSAVSEEKHSESNATAVVEKSGPSSIADVNEIDTTKALEKSRSPSITDVKHGEREPIDLSKPSSLDVKISHSDLPDSKISTHDESLDYAIPTDSGKLTIDQIEKTIISGATTALERTSRSPSIQSDAPLKDDDVKESRSTSIASVHDSKLDEKDAVQALQKLAETITDKSAEVKDVTKSPLDETEYHGTPKDRSRSHSVFDAGDKTPLGRSRTASLFDDRVPESLRVEVKTAFEEPRGTYSYDESDETKLTKDDLSRKSSLKDDKKDSVSSGSRKSSLAKFEDAISKRSSVAIQEDIAGQLAEDYHTTTDEVSKVEDYIVNKYIIKKEKITSRVVEEIVMLYSMPKYMILELIEAIIMKKNVPRDFVVDYPKYDETCDSAVTSKDDHVDVIDIPPVKRHDIESYIQEEFITKNKKISSKVLDDLVTLKSVSRHIIIMIIEEIITKRKIQKAQLLEDGALDESFRLSETDSYEAAEQEDRLFDEENLPSISTKFDISSHTSISSSDIRMEQESGISEQKRVEVESYVMEECVKKGKRITVLVLEQIMTKMSVSRSVLLDIIENIIVTRKMSRKTMVDDAIYDDVDTETSKSPEMLSTKDRVVEFSGKSTPDPKSSGYSTPETRQYDEKLTKELSSYSSDYESPFHKAFVGGMTEIRTTHITTLSGKSTPDFGARGETPESLSDSMTSSSQTKADEKVPSVKETLQASANEFNDTVEQASSISTVGVAMTTTTTTASSALGSVPGPKDYGVSVASEKAAGEQASSDDLSKRMKRDTVTIESKSQLGDVPDMTKTVPRDTSEKEQQQSRETTEIIRKEVITEEEPDVITRVIRREVIGKEEEEDPEVITRVIKREVIGDDEEEESEVITRVIRREVIGTEEEEEPEVITRVIRREVIGDDEEDEPEVITRVIRREVIADEEEEPEVITRVIRREIIDRDDEEGSPDTFETITTRTTKTIVTEDMPHHDKSDIQTTPEKVTSESGSTYVTRIASQDSLSGGPISADVKRTITTVTTVTEPDGKVTTKKDVQESTDTLEGDELLEKLIDSTKSDDSDTLTHAKSIESLKTEKIITETIKTVSGTSATGIRGDFDSGKSTPDSALRDEKCDTLSKSKLEKIVAETVDHPISPIIKDLISDERSYSGKSSPEVPSTKDQLGSSTGKSTPDIPAPTSGRSTPDKRADSRSSTATPEGFRSSETIRTTITTTRTMSEDGDIITTTKEITEATNEKGEVTILTEKTDVKVEDRILPKDIGESSPKSDHSSMHSRAGTQAWGSDDRHTFSDDEVPGSPLSTTSQVGYSPQSTYHFGEQSFGKDSSHKSIEFSEADMSSSFYGELPDLPPRVTTLKSAYLDSGSSETSWASGPAPSEGDFSFKKFTVEKEFAGGLSEKSGAKRYVDDADLDFEKALMERKEMKRDRDDQSSTAASGYTNGNLAKPSSSTLSEEPKDSKDDSKRDPLADWGTPLGLPSPKPPRKFNLRTTARPTNSADISPDSLNFDAINDWGEPLRLPSPAPVADEASNKGTPVTPKKERKQPKKVISENIKNRKRSESPSKNEKKTKDAKNKIQPVYMDLTYVPHHGNSYYTSLEFFKRVRARYYVFSGTEPSREVYDALLDAKKTWEDKDLEVTMIPTYDTDTLGYWVADNEEALAANHIDLSPSASRCTINLQDHETSCSAYRLEF